MLVQFGLFDRLVAIALEVDEAGAEEEGVPMFWNEARIYKIRKLALETTISLTQSKIEVNAFVASQTEIIISQFNSDTHSEFCFNVSVLSSVNMHKLLEGQQIECRNLE